jgi:hypothetical protein
MSKERERQRGTEMDREEREKKEEASRENAQGGDKMI